MELWVSCINIPLCQNMETNKYILIHGTRAGSVPTF